MNRVVLDVAGDLAAVDGLAHNVPDAAQGGLADRHHHGPAGVVYGQASGKAVGRGHGDRADDAVLELGLDLEHRVGVAHGSVAVDAKGRVYARYLVVELDINHRSNDAHDSARARALVELLVHSALKDAVLLSGVF